MYAPALADLRSREFFSDFPAYNRAGRSDRASLLAHSPHGGLGATPGTNVPAPTPPPAATTSHTVLYVGLGLGALAVGGLVIYLATHKKGRRR